MADLPEKSLPTQMNTIRFELRDTTPGKNHSLTHIQSLTTYPPNMFKPQIFIDNYIHL